MVAQEKRMHHMSITVTTFHTVFVSEQKSNQQHVKKKKHFSSCITTPWQPATMSKHVHSNALQSTQNQCCYCYQYMYCIYITFYYIPVVFSIYIFNFA